MLIKKVSKSGRFILFAYLFSGQFLLQWSVTLICCTISWNLISDVFEWFTFTALFCTIDQNKVGTFIQNETKQSWTVLKTLKNHLKNIWGSLSIQTIWGLLRCQQLNIVASLFGSPCRSNAGLRTHSAWRNTVSHCDALMVL